ncbi:MAG: caspase family protein [Spirulina sp. DLM2.Bin59]|nr:MAG: caspase family protein [Spirulina sp. DLM2.Bin59]
MGLDRRTFLQRVGLALLTTGTGAIAPSPSWAASATQYQETLTAGGPRKLALLVGINRYPHHPALEGCVMDVELQRDLLIHRFGFLPADIVTLTDQQGTRENIETAFSEHLIKQAKTGDQVVFHFSGYGAQVHSSGDQPLLLNRLVSVDRETAEATEVVGNGVLEETLLLLLRSLPTTQALVVLDTAYQSFGQLLQGSWRSRSHPDAPAEYPSQAELAVAEQLRQRLGRARFKANLPPWQQWPGLLLGADGALEGRWSGVTAGLLTYSLTQWLWAHTPAPTLWFTLEHLSETLTPTAAQEPYTKGKVQGDRPLFKTTPIQPTGIEG